MGRKRIIHKSFEINDLDALTFITATGITDPTQIFAINYLVTNLKLNNLWTKFKALYPFVGGTAFTHKFNLIDPRDLDISFRLQFSGGLVHSLMGVFPDGITGCANTFLNPAITLSSNYGHLSYYSRTNGTFDTLKYSIGTLNTNNGNFSLFLKNQTGSIAFVADHAGGSTYRTALTANSNTRGYYIGTQQGSNIKIFKDNSLLVANTSLQSAYPIPNNTINLFSIKQNSSIMYYDNKECALVTIGYRLTDLEALNCYNIVQQYETILSRQV